MGKHNALTEREKRFIEANAEHLSIGEMALALGRSYYTVQHALRPLGKEKAHRWTPEEDVLLLAMYGRKDTSYIAEVLGVDTNSVYNRVRRIRKKKEHG